MPSPILYIHPLLTLLTCRVITSDGSEIYTLEKNTQTSERLPILIVDLVKKYDIREIWCVTGPGPFTLMRIVTLTLNSLAYTGRVRLKSCHFFDLITSGNTPIIEANNTEYLVKHDAEVVTIEQSELPKGTYEGISTRKDFTEGQLFVEYTDQEENIKKIFEQKLYEDRIAPIYFKPPHITWSKKNTSHS